MQIKINIDWSDLDLLGHVNNVAYFKFIQSARINFCNLLGIETTVTNSKNSFVVANCNCDFLKPIFYPESITIKTNVAWVKNSSFQLVHFFINSSNEHCAVAKDVIVIYDYTLNKKILLSDPQIKFLNENLI